MVTLSAETENRKVNDVLFYSFFFFNLSSSNAAEEIGVMFLIDWGVRVITWIIRKKFRKVHVSEGLLVKVIDGESKVSSDLKVPNGE